MVSYTIVPRVRGYWIVATGNNGVRHPLERHDTEDKAVQRLHELQANATTIKERNEPLLKPKKRH
jgi:hypothetical protein